MASTIVTKNSTTAASAPTISDIIQGELASNLTDGFLFSRDEANNIVSFGVIKQGASSTETPRFDGTNWLPSAALLNDGTDITVAANLTTATFTLGATLLTVTGAELNYVAGVTSDIQTQLNSKTGTGTITYETLDSNGDVGTSAGQLAIGNHTHTGVYAPVASPTFTGTVSSPITNITGKATFSAEIVETVYAIPSSTTPELDPADGTIQTWTLTGNSTPTHVIATGESITLKILDGTAYTITWPTMEWIGGSAPTLDTAEDNWIVLWNVGGTLFGNSIGASS